MKPWCKDCKAELRSADRAAPHPGPRCATHWRVEQKRRSAQAHGRMITNGYQMSPEQYQLLLAYQNGRCFICQKSTGQARRLAVEHEHGLEGCEHPAERGCPRCWRGLACKRCNRLVAFLDANALARAIVFLMDPPARKLFGT